ncbi:hypothetical protein BX661DRAFT_187950 [Kickxella alabastrina]|uniref:uncharacterized protein n=1 Tax=Kickxella alabastrina TaxID=61397 RepID=UPI00221F3E91|nr:uncharacterized protein BX661DRAFT_187950 [Kickxella alabastrina]KAI7821791.1 hypothetical protein BX661DRAFT_187950 [Kickxella alabastrina]
MSLVTSLFAKAKADINDIFDPSKVPGSSVYTASNGTDLGMQAIFAASFFTVFILLFSALRLRWPYIFSPRTRLTITAPPFLSKRFFGWLLATMHTPETHILNTLGLDSVIFLRFYKMCMRLLLDVAFFSIVIIWPLNIRWSKANLNPQTNGNNASAGTDSDGNLDITLTYSVTDYLFNLTLNTSDPKQKWYLVPHIVFAYIFSGLAYYHISKFSSRWASLRWHFLMQSRHARVSRTVMLTGVPRHLASSPRELEWFCGPGLQLGKVEQVRVCPFNTRLTSSVRERAKYLVRLEQAYMRLLGNPCMHPEYDPEKLYGLAMDHSEGAREAERALLGEWAKPSRQKKGAKSRKCSRPAAAESPSTLSSASPETDVGVVATEHKQQQQEYGENPGDSDAAGVRRPMVWVRSEPRRFWRPWERVDAIDHWRTKFLAADRDFQQLRDSLTAATGTGSSTDTAAAAAISDNAIYGQSTTAFVTFEDAASAHMMTQLSCYPNPGFMKAKLAPEPRGVYWANVWISNRRKWAGLIVKWLLIFVIWAFWSVPVILFSSLLTPASLARIFPTLLDSHHKLLRSFLSSTVPSVFLLLFLNMLPWILKQVHFATGVRTKPDIDYSVMTKMWAFLVFNVILVFGFSGTFWDQILNVVNKPSTVMQNLASNIPRVGTFFTGYILVLGVGYQPFKLLQLRPVIWHIGRQWLCNTPRDYARLVSPVYIDWYSVYPYPLLVFGIAMVYSTFSPPVVLGAVIYFVIGYPVMKYLLLYVYFHPFETAGMAWPKVCRRMIFSIILYQVVILTFVVVKGGGWFTFSMVPIIVLYLWFFYYVGWSLEKQGTVLPVYLWRNPPPNSAYPLPPDSMDFDDEDKNLFTQPLLMNHAYDTSTHPVSQANPGASALHRLSGGGGGGGRSYTADFDSHRAHDRPPWQNIPAASPRSRSIARPPPLPLPMSSSLLVSPHSRPLSSSRVAKRSAGNHRRESSRGVRTREIILANRTLTKSSRPDNRPPLTTSTSGSYTNPLLAGSSNISPLKRKSAASLAAAGMRNQKRASNSQLRASHALQQHQQKNTKLLGVSGGNGQSRLTPPAQEPLQLQRTAENKRKKRYKSLAEAATVEGSRLILSLGRLPSELYNRHIENKRNSMSAITDMSTQLISSRESRVSSGARIRPWSFSGGKLQTLEQNPLAEENQLRSDSAVGSADSDLVKVAPAVSKRVAAAPSISTSTSKSSRARYYNQARVHLRSPLSHEVSPQPRQCRRRRRHLQQNGQQQRRPQQLDSHVQMSKAAENNSDEDGDNDGWVNESDVMDAQGLSTLTVDRNGWEDLNEEEDWDPLVYLKSSSSDVQLHDKRGQSDGNGATLGTLLTDLDHNALVSESERFNLIVRGSSDTAKGRARARPMRHNYASHFATGVLDGRQHLESSPLSGLRQRRVRGRGGTANSEPSVGKASTIGEVAASSIIDAERSSAYNVTSEDEAGGTTSQRTRVYVRRVRSALQRMRDYFLADFRPAGPILDLTYDRLYSQGVRDTSNRVHTDANGELVEDNGDTLPPLRQILGRVLPRSMSRTFSQAPVPPILPTASTSVPLQRSSLTDNTTSPYYLRARSATSPRPIEDPPARQLPPKGWRPSLAQILANSDTSEPIPAANEESPGNSSGNGGGNCDSSDMQGADDLLSGPPVQEKFGLSYKSSQLVLPPRPMPIPLLSTSIEMWPNSQPNPSDIPPPPRAPWARSPLAGHSRSASQPLNAQRAQQQQQQQQNMYNMNPALLSAGSLTGSLPPPFGGRRASHKNSLPQARARIPARIVSELNYVSRRSATQSNWQPSNQPRQQQQQQQDRTSQDYPISQLYNLLEDDDLLMTANYQRFAVEAQSTFAADGFTDYSQTPMLNFRGILDRGIQDYVHPGLVGELPTLWLPVKFLSADVSTTVDSDETSEDDDDDYEDIEGQADDQADGSQQQTSTNDVRLMALSAPQRLVRRIIRQLGARSAHTAVVVADASTNGGPDAKEQAYYARDPDFDTAAVSGSGRRVEEEHEQAILLVDEPYSELLDVRSDNRDVGLDEIAEIASPLPQQ